MTLYFCSLNICLLTKVFNIIQVTKHIFSMKCCNINKKCSMKCMDEGAKDEAATHGVENSLQLNCFINQEVCFI